MDASTGRIVKNEGKDISYTIEPYSSLFLLATNNKIPESKLSKTIETESSKVLKELPNWNIKVGDVSLSNSPLFDWITNDSLKYKSEIGVYSTTFDINNIVKDKKYLLDLGTVYYDAEVFLNGKSVGKKIWMPFEFDITSLLQKGKNLIEVRVTPTFRNEFIGEGLKGNSKYLRFRGKEKTLLSTGLIGPVLIKSE